MKVKTVLLFIGTVADILAIVEFFGNLGILNFIYSTVDKTQVFYILMILGTAFIFVYFIEFMLRPKRGGWIAFSGRRRPGWADSNNEFFNGYDFDVEWRLYKPPFYRGNEQPWADGPYCPNCKRELEERKARRFSKEILWVCPICGREFPKPEGDAKDMVEKNFAAYLRKKGEL
jgi:ribosomal protein L37AE/L43A